VVDTAFVANFVVSPGRGDQMGPSDRLAGVFRKALELGDAVDVEGLTYRGVPAWDSLGHMALVAAIEEEFGVELDSDQVIDMASFPIALKMLRDMGVDG
jgi:acyl carrier protein